MLRFPITDLLSEAIDGGVIHGQTALRHHVCAVAVAAGVT
jgi:hypothetical protein